MVTVTPAGVKVKICGITNLKDALVSLNAGCDALGFAFYRKSPRYIAPGKVRAIIAELPSRTCTIGVFCNARERTIKRIARMCRLDMLQFHGNESPAFCRRFPGYKVIKAFRVGTSIREDDILTYDTFAYLFDSFSKGVPGGTGKKFDWELIRHFGRIKKPIFLSGGLTERNVHKAVKAVKPEWVDVCSSIEERPGLKDHAKVAAFVKAAKAAHKG